MMRMTKFMLIAVMLTTGALGMPAILGVDSQFVQSAGAEPISIKVDPVLSCGEGTRYGGSWGFGCDVSI